MKPRTVPDNMLGLRSLIDKAAAAIRQRWSETPVWGVVLGSGLGPVGDRIDSAAVFEYAELPHFPRTTATGHRGRLIGGRLGGVPVCIMQGRFHLYEGWTAEQASFPIRVMKALGVSRVLLSNAAGGVNPRFRIGDLMLIVDQINLMFANPLVGINDDELGPRFPDMSAPYCPRLQQAALSAARGHDLVLHRGVYAGLLGPTYETRSEYRMCRLLGADVVGMSTVPETIAAVHAGMQVLAFSTVTNDASSDALTETTAHEVIDVASTTADKLAAIAETVIANSGMGQL